MTPDMKSPDPRKPLAGKAYGSIPHLPGSKFGNRDDKGLDAKAAAVFTGDRPIGKMDMVVLLEKLDGTSVAIANIKGEIVPLIRSGFRAITSKYHQHHMFHDWVMQHFSRFADLNPGERICGEWLAQAHGTRYYLAHREPFAAFDFFVWNERQPWIVTQEYCLGHNLTHVPLLGKKIGSGVSISDALFLLGDEGKYDACDHSEGVVWRWERYGWYKNPERNPIMMAKYVRPIKEVGKYLPTEEHPDLEPVWNWRP